MSFQTLKKLVSKGVLQVGSIWTGDPRKNEIIKYIGEKHKVGFFESVNKLCIRASLEDEDTFNELYIQRLIVIKNTKSNEEYRANHNGVDMGTYSDIDNFYEKIKAI